MSEQQEYVLFRTIFVMVAVLLSAAIGGLFSWKLALAFGTFQFVFVMLVTRKKVAFTERNPTPHVNDDLRVLLKEATKVTRPV